MSDLNLTFSTFEIGLYNFTTDNDTIFINGTESGPNNEADSVYAISNGVSIVFIIIVITVIFFWRRYQRNKKKLKKMTKDEVTKFLEGDCQDGNGLDPESNIPFSIPYNRDFEISLSNIAIDQTKLLGSGAYGLVYKGTLIEGQVPVAVKTLKPNADIMYFKSLLSELKVMIYIGEHENIVKCLGACTAEISSRKLYIVVELCVLGSLETYLRDHRSDLKNFTLKQQSQPSHYQNVKIETTNLDDDRSRTYCKYVNVSRNGEPADKLTVRDLIRYCYEISNAMEYLSGKKVVHGDLATRNVLLNENRKVKVTDFGLSRQMINYTNYVRTDSKQNPLPWRWLAIETIKEMNFSSKSDVWAFGITIWEIFSLAQVPYPGLAYSQDFLKMLEKGLRMNSPSDFTPPEMYKIMVQTWHENPEERPTFLELKGRLMELGL